MKRRNFLKIAAPLSVSPFVVNGMSMRPFANSKLAKLVGDCDGIEDRVLVLIQLKGGNDGLNMVVPINQYDLYSNLRPTIRVPDTGAGKYINLDTTLKNSKQVGLHPMLAPIKNMYDDGMVSVIQGVGYSQPNQSHFKSTDLWMTGGDGTADNFNIKSGWMGRALQALFPDVHGAPTPDMLDPLGIQVGDQNISLGFHTETEHVNALNLTGQDPAGFYSLIQTIGGQPISPVPDTEYGHELDFIMNVERSTNLYAQRITDVFNKGKNIGTYPTANNLGNQLKTVARLINGGCKTKIYLCSLGGFDTHNAQILSEDILQGDHAGLMKTLADAVKAFFDDLKSLGHEDQVTGVTFSEFGRCARENGSIGTDHGTLAPMMVFGKNTKAGVLGDNVNLSNLTNDNQLQGMQHDYRQVFATLLQDWLGANHWVMEETMFDGYSKLGLVDAASVVDPGCYLGGTTVIDDTFRPAPLTIFPNPARFQADISFEAMGDFDAALSVHSLGGQMIYGKNVRIFSGSNLFYLDVANYPAGNYFVRLQNRQNGTAEVTKLAVVR